MFFMEYKYGKTQSIWAETSEKWDEAHPSWKTVGQSPRRVPKEAFEEALRNEDLRRFSIEHIFQYEKIHYRVVFSSGRQAIGASRSSLALNEFVIIEADRGEDCAVVRERLGAASSAEVKNILRVATERDIEVLEMRKKQEVRALEKCILLVRERGYPMEVTRCEFQWDMRKITFYFKSTKRIDFRDLVKELFKFFKIRIWMSMENRNSI